LRGGLENAVEPKNTPTVVRSRMPHKGVFIPDGSFYRILNVRIVMGKSGVVIRRDG
jgi:hypothetical protein